MLHKIREGNSGKNPDCLHFMRLGYTVPSLTGKKYEGDISFTFFKEVQMFTEPQVIKPAILSKINFLQGQESIIDCDDLKQNLEKIKSCEKL